MSKKIEPTKREVWSVNRDKSRRPGRLVAVFRAFVLLALLGVTAYAMLRHGIYTENLWLPVAAGIFALLLITIFVSGYYGDVPWIGLVLVILLAALVGIKGISMTWSIGETETVREILRSSMYLATFLIVLGALSSERQVAPLMDIAVLIVAAVAGYGLLQKISPIAHPITSLDDVRIDSTLGYVNTFAVVLGMGVALALARMARIRNAVFRGLYAVLILAFLVALYLTASRGGIASLGIGSAFLFTLTNSRLHMFASLLLLSIPGVWLVYEMRDLNGLWQIRVPDEQKIADGTTFRNYLIVALVVAFVLQLGYSLLANRYELMPLGRRALGALVLGSLLLVACAGAYVVVNHYGGVAKTYSTLVAKPDNTKDVNKRLASASIGFRQDYWEVAWKAWKEHPLTGTGAGTFQYTWLKDRPINTGVKQVHNLYLEQGTETGIFAFLAIVGFAVVLVGYTARAVWRSRAQGDRPVLLAGLGAAMVVYLVSSAFEWHWYIPASTLFFFFLAALTAKFAAKPEWSDSKVEPSPAAGKSVADSQPPPQTS